MEKKKKIIILCAVMAVAVVAVLYVSGVLRPSSASASDMAQTKALQKMDIADTVDITGAVESTNSVDVYSASSSMPVDTVNVSVGDTVTQGSVLCRLNTDNLEKQIQESQAALDAAKKNGVQSVKTNQMKYDNDVANLKNGQDSAINQAKASVDDAQTRLSQSQYQYELYVQAEKDAKTAMDAAQAVYDTEYAADPASAATATAKAALDSAQAANATAHQTQAAYSSTYNGAQKAYDNAVAAYNAAVTTANQQIEADRQALESSKTSANTDSQEASLESLLLQLSQATITSPVSGTVTAVNAVAGGMPNGALFTVKDTGLQILTSIDQYDINKISVGMEVTIQSDGTGSDIYLGKIKRIDPMAVTSSSSADTSSTGNAIKYSAIIAITSESTKLKMGMSTRLSIILDQKKNVLAVPYDAVTANTAGEKVVYAMVKGDNGKDSVQEIPVYTGMQNNFYIEVSGKGLQEGMMIVTNPDSVKNNNLPLASATATLVTAGNNASATGSK